MSWRIKTSLSGALLTLSTLTVGLSYPLATVHAQDATTFNTGQASPELSEREKRTIQFYFNILKAEGDLENRVFAATNLMEMQLPQIQQQLAQLLADSKDVQVQLAIIRAMQTELKGKPPETLVKPLTLLMLTDKPELKKEVHEAISNMPDPLIVQALSDVAYDEKSSDEAQKTAIMLLGKLSIIHHRRRATETLLNMFNAPVGDRHSKQIFEALENIHKIQNSGPEEWRRWWDANRLKDDREILRETITTVTRNLSSLRSENQNLRKELLELQEKLFYASSKTDRPQQLISMLSSSRDEIQRLGLQLVLILFKDGETINDPILKQVRKLLDDTDSGVRISAAKVIRDLSDPDGIKLIEDRLVDEQNPAVLDAYLMVLSRQPKEKSIAFAMKRFLQDNESPALIRFLIAARAADQLTQAQRDALFKVSQDQIKKGVTSPGYAGLFTSIAPNDTNTRTLLTTLLENKDKDVRMQSARGAFLNNRLPLDWSAKYLKDPDLRNIVLEAFAKRADNLTEFKELMKAPPADSNQNPRWLGTMQTVAGKMDTSDLLLLDDELSKSNEPIKKTIDLMIVEIMAGRLQSDNPDPRRVELAERVPTRLYELGKLSAARNLIMSRLLPKNNLPKELKQNLILLAVNIDLQTGKYNALDNSVKVMLQDKNEKHVNQVFERMMTQIDSLRKNKDDKSADLLLSKAETLLSPHLSETQKQQLAERKTKPETPSNS